ncbi:MAG: hypothetical protein H7Y37_13710 [Anaerolineae bacterium]|nr:hypothetical protein [Gloeobacterales cyanobacterium ES-bin-313]
MTQLESIEAIQRLSVLAISVAVKTLQMMEGRERPDIPASIALSEQEQQCLLQIAPTLEGKTSITKIEIMRGLIATCML